MCTHRKMAICKNVAASEINLHSSRYYADLVEFPFWNVTKSCAAYPEEQIILGEEEEGGGTCPVRELSYTQRRCQL